MLGLSHLCETELYNASVCERETERDERCGDNNVNIAPWVLAGRLVLSALCNPRDHRDPDVMGIHGIPRNIQRVSRRFRWFSSIIL
jgi:hypothetical protein